MEGTSEKTSEGWKASGRHGRKEGSEDEEMREGWRDGSRNELKDGASVGGKDGREGMKEGRMDG